MQKGRVEPCVGVQVISKSSSGPSKATRLGFLQLSPARNVAAFLLFGFRSGLLAATFPALTALAASLAQRKDFVGAGSESDCNLSP